MAVHDYEHWVKLERRRQQVAEQRVLVGHRRVQTLAAEPGADVRAVAQQEVHPLRVADEVDAPAAGR